MKKVSAIVAAYNEEPTIAEVVRTLKSSSLITQVIVVSDGSTDSTGEMARKAGADVVHELPLKKGKGAAISHGVTRADGEILFFSDADLIGFRVDHIATILKPVLDGKLQMCVGLRDRGKFWTALSRYMPLIGGERAMRRNIFISITSKYLQGFMLEPALNYYCRSRKLPYSTMVLHGLRMRRKMQKVGFWKGLKEYIGMSWQIGKAMAVVRAARLAGRF